MTRSLDQEIRSFERRVDLYAFLGGAADGALVGAVGLLGLGLVLRLLGVAFTPAWWLLGVVAVAALVGGAWRLRSLRFGVRDSAAHLDRRLGLDGLLLASREKDVGAWREQIDTGLEDARTVRPHLAPGPVLGRSLLAAAAVAILFLLPPAVARTSNADRLAAETLAEFEARLEKLEEEQGLDPEAAEEVRERYEGLKEEQERSGTLAWEDFDALDARLEHEQDLKAGRLAKAAAAMSAFAAEAASRDPTEAEEAFQELLELARKAGLVEKLPQELQDQMGLGEGAGGAAGADGLSLDAETMAQLATALAGLAGDELTSLADAGLLEGLSPEELQRLVQELLAAAEAGRLCKLCDGEAKECGG